MTQGDAIRKSIVMFEGIRRAFSKGNTGLEAQKGYETEFRDSDEILLKLREVLRDMERSEKPQEDGPREWQTQLMAEGGPPRVMEI